MALWQVGFFIIPRISISSLEISNKTSLIDPEIWSEIKTDVNSFDSISHILPKNKSWASYITLYGEENSNRLEVISENNIIESVSFLIDFRSNYEPVLTGILKFCILNNYVILDEQMRIVPLDFESIKLIIQNAPQVEKYKKLSNGALD